MPKSSCTSFGLVSVTYLICFQALWLSVLSNIPRPNLRRKAVVDNVVAKILKTDNHQDWSRVFGIHDILVRLLAVQEHCLKRCAHMAQW